MQARSTRRAAATIAAPLAAAALLLGAASLASADDEVQLSWKFEPGRHRVFKAYTQMWMTRQVGDATPGKVHLEVSQRYEDTYGETDEEGLIPYWHILKWVRVDASYGRDRIHFDSAKDPAEDRKKLDPRVAPFVKALDEVRMSKIDPVKGTTVGEGGEGAPPFLSGRKVALGASWTEERKTRVGRSPLVLTERFTLRRVEPYLGRERCAWIDISLAKAVAGTADDTAGDPIEVVSSDSKGEVVFDLEAGLIVRRSLEERLKVRRTIREKPGAPPIEETEERRIETTFELTEERRSSD